MPKRNYSQTDFKAFSHIATQLDMSASDLVAAIGQSRGNASTWEKRGWVQKTAYLAAEGLLRRSRKRSTSSNLFLVSVPNGKLAMFQEIASGLGFRVIELDREL